MIHLIRHAPKAYDNGRKQPWQAGASHDPPLADQAAANKACELANRLLLQEDDPGLVLSSPFLRCRQTAKCMGAGDDLFVSPLLREYLGNWETRKHQIRITNETESYLLDDTILVETWPEFRSRSELCADWLIYVLQYLSDGRSVWVITHGSLMKQLNRDLSKRGFPVALHWLDKN